MRSLERCIGRETAREKPWLQHYEGASSKIWKLQGGFEIMDNDNSFYMVKFDQAEDRENNYLRTLVNL